MPEKNEVRTDLGACGCGNDKFEFSEKIDTVGGASLNIYKCTSCGNGKTVETP